jgi:hypothetical protein
VIIKRSHNTLKRSHKIKSAHIILTNKNIKTTTNIKLLTVPHKILNNISLVYNGQARESAYVIVRILSQEPTVDLKQFTEAFQRKTEATRYATFRTASTGPDITLGFSNRR